jgi:3,4-dihydroxy 2-butanone 4-phosphate synthase / GTP cyclohydrolase II
MNMSRMAALGAYLDGNPVVILDDRLGYVPATLVTAAETVTAEAMAFVVRYTCGFVTVALPTWRCDQLDLPAIAASAHYLTRPIAAVSVDAADGVSTGISAADRSFTARLLVDADTEIDQLTRPGHLVPMRVPNPISGQLTSPAAAALKLCELVDSAPGAVCCELVESNGELMSTAAARVFADDHALYTLSLDEVAQLAAAEIPAVQIA